MEHPFENQYQFDRKMVTEYMYRLGGLRMVIWGICSLALAVYYTIGLAQGKPDVLVLTLFVGLSAYYLSYPFVYVRKMEKKLTEHFRGEIPPTRVCFGDHIDVRDGESEYSLDYTELEKITAMKYGYYLRYDRNRSVGIKRDGFVKGDFEAFKAFLRQKRPDLKIPD